MDRCVAEMVAARGRVAQPPEETLLLYGAAALIESFYTGIEKALTRIARQFGGLPDGEAWHRQLLRDASLDVPSLRPAVLSQQGVAGLEPYLAFRHRFRNLYVFDLEVMPIVQLLNQATTAWQVPRAELEVFAALAERWATELGG